MARSRCYGTFILNPCQVTDLGLSADVAGWAPGRRPSPIIALACGIFGLRRYATQNPDNELFQPCGFELGWRLIPASIAEEEPMALRPQPPVPQSVPQFFEPPTAPEPLRGLWAGIVAAAFLIFTALGSVFKEIAARWRGIVLAHIFFLTLWLAVQVFFFVSGAYWCLPNDGSKFSGWFSKYFPQVSRCGPPVASHGATPPTTTLAVTAFGSAKAAPVSSASSADASASSSGASVASSSASSPLSPPPSATASSAGPASAWSSKSIANCWRNRSVDGGSCYGRSQALRKSAPARSRYPAYPCRRPSECGWDRYSDDHRAAANQQVFKPGLWPRG
jgi:hypothetical protein